MKTPEDQPHNTTNADATPRETGNPVIAAAITAAGQIIGGWLTGRPAKVLAPAPAKGSVDYFTDKFVSSRWFAPIIFLAIIIISAGALIDGLVKVSCVATKVCALLGLCPTSCTL